MDNETGARLAVEHLASRGRRVVATIAGPPDMTAGRDRYAGFLAGLVAAGQDPDPGLTAHGDFSQGSGEHAMRELLGRRPDVDGVFCANDLMAAGALRVLHESGRRVPEDVSLVGFEDSAMALSTQPPLTSVHQSSEEMGRVMVELLLEQLAEPVEPPPSRILPTHLVVRASS
jgi:DNA-binding LacI/PurR family transcriptional regulator